MNYIGSKKKLLSFIFETILGDVGTLKNKIFCDAFAGTGAVGHYARSKGAKVIANDVQEYAFVLNKNLIENNLEDLDEDLFYKIKELKPIAGFVTKEYCSNGARFFTEENGKKCDAILLWLKENREKIGENNYYYIMASLINSMDRVANTTSVYGAYLKQYKKSSLCTLVVYPMLQADGPKGVVYKEDFNSLVYKISGDVLYLDPPYNTRQYSKNYSVLETIALNDEPELHGKTRLRNDCFKSDFSTPKKVESSFEEIIKNANFEYIYLSYNSNGLLSTSKIEEIMSKYGEYKRISKNYNNFNPGSGVKEPVVEETMHSLRK